MARRYHWISDGLEKKKAFVSEPHAGIICGQKKADGVLDMTAAGSQQSQQVCLDLARDGPSGLKSSINRIAGKNTLDTWIDSTGIVQNTTGYEMPRHLDWDLFRRIYDVQPKNYEELVGMQGVGAATVRALALVAELIYGAKASWRDPVKYSFAHGGKDGVPHPVARKVYDQSIAYLSGAIEGAEIERNERTDALKKLAAFSSRMFPES
jgi:hypothetical protein